MNEAKFVWHELMTVDPKSAKEFYPKLFGWTFRDQEMGGHGSYTMWMAGDRAVGGMMAIDKSHGFPSAWYGYATVPAVDAAARRAPQQGAKVLVPPTDVPDIGRFAMLQDAQGAVVSAFKPMGPDMEEEAPRVGQFCWDELHTTDTKAACAFYGEVFGWKIQGEDMGGGFGMYHLLRWGEHERGGIVKSRDGVSRWYAYVLVDDVDALAKQAEKLGGKLVAPPMDIPMGRFAMVVDPAGAPFALWKSKPRK